MGPDLAYSYLWTPYVDTLTLHIWVVNMTDTRLWGMHFSVLVHWFRGAQKQQQTTALSTTEAGGPGLARKLREAPGKLGGCSPSP